MRPDASRLLTQSRIKLDVGGTSQRDAIMAVASLLTHHPDVLNFPAFCEELFAREKVNSTATGHGVAFPHARTDHVREIVLAAGRSKAGVLFEGGERVQLIFVVGTPRHMIKEYLVIVGALARLLKDAALRQQLMDAESAEEIQRILGGRTTGSL